MGNMKNKSIITCHGRDAGKRLMNQDSTKLAFLTDFSKIEDTVRRRRSMIGQKISVKKWTNELKKITLTS